MTISQLPHPNTLNFTNHPSLKEDFQLLYTIYNDPQHPNPNWRNLPNPAPKGNYQPEWHQLTKSEIRTTYLKLIKHNNL